MFIKNEVNKYSWYFMKDVSNVSDVKYLTIAIDKKISAKMDRKGNIICFFTKYIQSNVDKKVKAVSEIKELLKNNSLIRCKNDIINLLKT